MSTFGISNDMLIQIANEAFDKVGFCDDPDIEYLDEFAYLIVNKIISVKEADPVKHILKDVLGVGYE